MLEEAYVDLAERIRTARKARQWSQEDLAHRAGLSLRAYRSLERGEAVDPHYSTLNKLASGLSVPVGDLLEEPTLSGKAKAPEAKAGVVVEMYRWGDWPSRKEALKTIYQRAEALRAEGYCCEVTYKEVEDNGEVKQGQLIRAIKFPEPTQVKPEEEKHE